ncbi:EamA/RhaT family transporter [Psychrobacter sp. I-STPA6b]|uniref:EamA/RhaT family transporter n=1 Tax=Psychrobacter sp. I-STPA6b TaxID=2585718 RepID=UPI001D0C020E|nr:EamA/RhaT family transporter [Psychrobacter sp. I-STPA6b]
MVYLVLAVLCSVSVSILLKVLRQRDMDIRQTIVMGYPVALMLTWLLLKPDISLIESLTPASWAIILALGILLPSVFVILGRALSTAGIIATDAAQRLSLIIPIVAAFILFGELLTTQRLMGIILGFLALIALLYRDKPADIPTTSSRHTLDAETLSNTTWRNTQQNPSIATSNKPLSSLPNAFWLLGVWLGYGVIDILFKQVAKQGTAFSLTLLISFGLAGLLLLIYLLLQRIRWQRPALLAGLLLGMLNMGNIYAYVKAHQTLADSPSIVFTGMNVGVIALATVVGVIWFKESLNKANIVGLGLAVACVLVLFLG